MQQSATVSGFTQTSAGTIFVPSGGATTLPNGVFAQPGVVGNHTRNRFSALAEFGAQAGYQMTGYSRIFLGYNFLLLGNVSRPGDEVDRNLNPTRTGLADAGRAAGEPIPVVGPPAPTFGFHDSNFWAQGINVGVELRR